MATLYEKELDFKLHFVDPAKFEQHSDWYKKINPRGQVPALDHDGRVVTESTVICEYLEDVFPDQNPLRPADPIGARRCGYGPSGSTNISAGASRPSAGTTASARSPSR